MLRFVLSVCACLFGSVASAQTPFPARFVDAGKVVTVPKGNYTMTQQVVIRAGGTLILQAGVNVQVSNLGLPMQVYGALIINGTASDPVVVGPDASGVCGTLQTYASPTSRPSIQATYLDWTTTKNSNALFLSACDFTIINSKITSKATAAANRTCVAAVGGSVGSLSNCMLDACNETVKTLCDRIGWELASYGVMFFSVVVHQNGIPAEMLEDVFIPLGAEVVK